MRILRVWKGAYACLFPILLLSQQQQPTTQSTAPDQGQQESGGGNRRPSNKPQMTRIHQIEDGKGGGISELSEFSKDPDRSVRLEAIRVIIKLGGPSSLPPLIGATHDADGEVRSKATSGIVNFYLPGYVGGTLKRGVRHVRGMFSPENTAVIDEDVTVRDDAAQAIIDEINFGTEMPPRANAARAAGVLRLRGAVQPLLEAIRSKNNEVIFESLIALQKIHDPSAGPGVGFLVRDLDERTQIAALETVGVLGSREAVPDVRYVVENARSLKIRRAALSALAMLAAPEDRTTFRRYVVNGDPEVRTAALEGLGRAREPEDIPLLQANYDQANADWRIHLAAAFALVYEGNVSTEEFSPLLYLVENLNSSTRADTADAYLRELTHREDVRHAIVKTLPEATHAQKMALCWILGYSRSADMLPALTQLGSDPDGEVSIAAKRAALVIQQTRPAP